MTDRSTKLDNICADWRSRKIWKLEPAEQARILRCQTSEEEQNLLMTIGLRRYALLYPPVVVMPSGNLLDITKARVERNTMRKERQVVLVKKAKAFDRVIERLDHEWVGNKLLRDCTKADLLRAAQNKDQGGVKMALERALYVDLASLLKGNETVADARHRGEVRKLLERIHEEA